MQRIGKIFYTAALIFLTSGVYAAPSSDIPERREFPVNPEVNPCQDFYKYTCSKVKESFKLREDRSHHTFSFSDSAERLLTKKKDYFKTLATAKPESPREESLKNVYLACMDIKGRKKAEMAEVARVKNELLKKITTRDELLNQIANSYLGTDSSPLSWGATANQDNSENNDLYILPDYLSLPEKSYYKKKDVIKDLRNLLVLFFKEVKSPKAAAQAQMILDFENGLAEVTPEPEQFRQIVNNRNPISRQELLKTFPHLGLDRLLSKVPETSVIRNWTPEAMAYTDKFLAEAPLENIKAIYLYNSLKGYLDDAYPKFYDKNFEFRKKHFGGPNVRPAREERCTRLVMSTFAKEIDSILVPKIFPNFPREKFVALAESIRSSIIDSLKENSWLTKDAKKEAIEKMKSARLQLVAPTTEKEWDFLPLAKYSSSNPIENFKTVSTVYRDKSLQELSEPTDKGRWQMGPLTVNAYYDPSYNSFVMPIGILQYPFYDPKLSDLQNAGAVGAVIGHELGHGIDDQGARYDSKGKQRQWMSMQDLKNFSDRTAPLITQFDSIGHNGRLTQGENIGDLVGLTAVYRLATKTKGFNESPEMQKELFLAYGRVWCSEARPKFEETQLKTDPHALGFARVNEQVKQQPGFAKAFQCKDSDPMVLPKEKQVRIW
jgi:putative endopeptidase